jgi:hypothetical protein
VIINFSLSGGAQDISSVFTSNAPGLLIQSMAVPRAYNTNQLVVPPNSGQIAYNTTTNSHYYWTGISWQPFGGSGSGIVCPGVSGFPVGYFPSVASTICPSTVAIDSTNDSTLGSLFAPKMVNNVSTNVINPYMPEYKQPGNNAGDFTYQLPQYLHYNGTQMYSVNPFFFGSREDLDVYGTSSFFLPTLVGYGGNAGLRQENTIAHSSIQGGGTTAKDIFWYGLGDTVADTQYLGCTGISEGFHEGCEATRHFQSFFPNVSFAPIISLSAGSAGRQIMQLNVNLDDTHRFAVEQFAGDRLIIDSTKQFQSTGNATTASICSDSRFICVGVDSATKTQLNTNLGSTSSQTTLSANIDFQKYNTNCPSAVTAPNFGTIVTNGVTYNVNPYNTDIAGNGGQTTNYCITVASTSGMSATQPISIWGGHDNWEYTTATVIDATHITAPVNFPHESGELVTWGAGAGWAITTPGEIINYHDADTGVIPQYTQEYSYYPVLRWDSTNSLLWLYVNQSATSNAELKLKIFPTLNPVTPNAITVTGVVGGVVQGITNVANNDYRTIINQPGTRPLFPPPTVTFGGTGSCSTNPTYHWTTGGNGSGYNLILDSGGTGCPSNISFNLTTTNTNPIILAPASRIYRNQNPSNGCSNCGYLLTQTLMQPSQWQIGDTVTQPNYWNQYSSVNDRKDYSVLNGGTSFRYGPMETHTRSFHPQGPALGPIYEEYWTNITPTKYYFGDSTTNYLPSQDTTSPTKSYFASMTPPIWRGVGGQYAGILDIMVPPTAGSNGSVGNGFIFNVRCILQGQDGPDNLPPCLRSGAAQYYQPFDYLRVSSNITGIHFLRWDDPSDNWVFDTQTVLVQALGGARHALCRDDGAFCKAQTPDYAMNWQGASTFHLNDAYYIGDSGAVQEWCGASCPMGNYKLVPADCKAKRVTVTAQIGEGGTPTTSTNTIQVNIHDWTTSTDLLTANFATGWNTVNQITYDNTNPAFTILAGDQITARIFAPAWGETTHTAYNVAFHLYCSYN